MRAAIALAWLLCLTHVIAIAASKIEVTSKAVRQSVVKALPLLARTGPTTFKKSGCVSCHNQSLPAVAMAMARERGLTVEEEAVREILRTSVAAFGLGRRDTAPDGRGAGPNDHHRVCVAWSSR